MYTLEYSKNRIISVAERPVRRPSTSRLFNYPPLRLYSIWFQYRGHKNMIVY